MKRIALTLLFGLACVAVAPAQVAQVPNTGCPGTTYPSFSGSARIGQRLDFSWSCSTQNQVALAFLGLADGGGLTLGAPVTCHPGPCTFFPGPIGGTLLQFPGEIQWTLRIPNDARLVGTRLAMQAICYCG